jgi:hypothetical protein
MVYGKAGGKAMGFASPAQGYAVHFVRQQHYELCAVFFLVLAQRFKALPFENYN